MLTAIEEKLRRERLIGFADAMRCLERVGAQAALQVLILEKPEAYIFVPTGSRPGEERLQLFAALRYDEHEEYACVRYWRPLSVNEADCTWMVPC